MTIASVLVQQAYRESNLIAVGVDPTTEEAAEGLTRLNNVVAALFGHGLGEQLQEWLVPSAQRTASVAAQYPLAPPVSDLASGVYLYPPQNSRLLVALTAATTVYFPEQPSDGARMAFVEMASNYAITLSGNGKKINGSTSAAAGVTITVTIASPGVVTWVAHGRVAGDTVVFTTSGALPTGLTAGTVYYVISAGLATDSFRVAATSGGTVIDTSGSQSGTHKGYAFTSGTKWFYRADQGNWIPLVTLLAASESPLPEEFDDLLICGLAIRLASRNSSGPAEATVAAYRAMLARAQQRYRQAVPQIGGGANTPPAYQSFARGGVNWWT